MDAAVSMSDSTPQTAPVIENLFADFSNGMYLREGRGGGRGGGGEGGGGEGGGEGRGEGGKGW